MVRLGFSASDVAVYSESALIGALVKADASLKPGTYALKGTVTFQACNDVSCLPPESRDFEMTIVVVESERETREIDTDVLRGDKVQAGRELALTIPGAGRLRIRIPAPAPARARPRLALTSAGWTEQVLQPP